MRLIPSDPDIRTVFGRIEDETLDLQPDFQRGAVWSRPKQRLLIDSILRNWYVPPIHVVRIDEDTQVVLDGQQRLRAIQHFMLGRFPVDGKTEPASDAIRELGGKRYDELPPKVRGRFDRFTLRLFELDDYEPEEPSELFFRLNQPATLTEAEKRNAFFGDARQQVRVLTEHAERCGMQPERIGFSSARLAYEDVVARFIWTLEAGTLGEKVTASRVTARYRTPDPFSDVAIDLAKSALEDLFSTPALDDPGVRLNKATAHTWLLYLARGHATGAPHDRFDSFFEWFERRRAERRPSAGQHSDDPEALGIRVFNDRATARVNDVSSVLLRDYVLWAVSTHRRMGVAIGVPMLWEALERAHDPVAAEALLLETGQLIDWARFR